MFTSPVIKAIPTEFHPVRSWNSVHMDAEDCLELVKLKQAITALKNVATDTATLVNISNNYIYKSKASYSQSYTSKQLSQ